MPVSGRGRRRRRQLGATARNRRDRLRRRLLAEGSGPKEINGVAYDSPTHDGSKLLGIGRDRATRIWYRALTLHMRSSTDYAAARTATLRSAVELYGPAAPEVARVAAAWKAVNVG
ncbi:M4 family metallopeptidase [Streptomyces sp. NPDC059104]|uniref:M4 family metallopeptidase n=1 Tax=Streptomyces sp. NPDC059104 TaxID=3346729 RepID=UPI0036C664E0